MTRSLNLLNFDLGFSRDLARSAAIESHHLPPEFLVALLVNNKTTANGTGTPTIPLLVVSHRNTLARLVSIPVANRVPLFATNKSASHFARVSVNF